MAGIDMTILNRIDMMILSRNTKKIIELEAKVEAWNDTWGKVKPDIPAHKIDELEMVLAELYTIKKLEKK